jgi:hypothetical protein
MKCSIFNKRTFSRLFFISLRNLNSTSSLYGDRHPCIQQMWTVERVERGAPFRKSLITVFLLSALFLTSCYETAYNPSYIISDISTEETAEEQL